MGFTVVDTKDKRGRVSAKEVADNMDEKDFGIANSGALPEEGDGDPSAVKRLGASRERARKADFNRKDKSMEEYEAKRAKVEADVKAANYLNIKDKK